MGTDETDGLTPERQTAIADRYRRLAGAFADKVAAVPDERWASTTPCEDWTARQLVQHVIDSYGMFLGFVDRRPDDLPSVDDEPVAAFDRARGLIQAELDDPDRASTTFDGLGGTTTFAEAADRFLAADLVVHGWDLARATGLDETIDPGELDRVAVFAESMGPMLRSSGAFGAEVTVSSDADRQTRVLAFLGREA